MGSGPGAEPAERGVAVARREPIADWAIRAARRPARQDANLDALRAPERAARQAVTRAAPRGVVRIARRAVIPGARQGVIPAARRTMETLPQVGRQMPCDRSPERGRWPAERRQCPEAARQPAAGGLPWRLPRYRSGLPATFASSARRSLPAP